MGNLEQEPIKEKVYHGIQGIEITSAGWLGHESELYNLVNQLNGKRAKDDQIGIEIYPTNLIVSAKNILNWEKENPRAKTNRIHLPFHYSLSENITGMLHDIKRKEIKEASFCLIWLGIFGVARNKKAVKIAKQLELEVGMHANLVEGFKIEGKLEEIKQNVPGVLVENTRPYFSNIFKEEDQKKIFDPLMIRETIKEYHLTGLIFDAEHTKKSWFKGIRNYENGIEPNTTIEKTKDVLAKIHIAGEKENHGVFSQEDNLFNSILKKVSQMDFNHPLKIVFDFDPRPFLLMKPQKKLEIIKSLVERVDHYRLS